jgi:hypothetical protein
MSRQPPKPKVTKADLARAAEFLRSMGAKVATVDVAPDRMRIVTTDGQGLTLDADDAELDRELAEYRQRNAHGHA